MVPYYFSRSSVKFEGHTGQKKIWFSSKSAVSGLKLEFEFTDDSEMMHKIARKSCPIIKSPRYTGGDFMFLYRFIRRRRPQILVHAITFENLFGFLSFLARLLGLTFRLPDYILCDLDLDHDLDFSRSNMEFAISPPKMVQLPRNEKQTYRLNSMA